jgi:hypothetical protein
MATAEQPVLDPANAAAEHNLEKGGGLSSYGEPETTEAPELGDTRTQKIWKHLKGEVDPDKVSWSARAALVRMG